MEEEWRDIKLLERKIELNKQMYLEFGRLLSLDEETVNAIENLINKNKELQKENEELKADLYSANSIINEYIDTFKNCIQKHKIKDKIEEKIQEAEKDLQKAIELEKETKTKEDSILWWTAQIRLDERIKVLKEILAVFRICDIAERVVETKFES